jgi:radical SAM superfamily enzyme YgiQ (UPF0313 family)
MRLLLVHPAFPYRGKDLFPIGLGYLAAVARDYAEISVIDDNVEAFEEDKVASFSPDIVGITSTTPSFPRALEIARRIKSLDIDAKIVMGGTHVTFRPEEALDAGIDIVVRGEGEKTFLELLRGTPLPEIKGISYYDGRTRHNPDRELIENLDSIPFPAHEFFPLHKYKIMSIVTSRGCPYSCSYCSATRFWRQRVRFRSPDNVVEELERIVGLGYRLVRFMDSTFTLDKQRAIEICRKIVDRGLDISWSCETRADHLTDDLLKALSSAGCNLICLGVDSGSQVVLNKNNRQMKVSTIRKAFEKAREYGIRTRAYVTFGLPGETPQSVWETIRLLEDLRPDQILLSLATAYPGTELWNGRFIDVHPSWISKFHGHGPGGKLYLSESLSRKDYTKLADQMYKEVKRINKMVRSKSDP